MSAFAAFQGNSNTGSIFSTRNNSEQEQEEEEEDDDHDDGLVQYQANSSDEDNLDDDDEDDDDRDETPEYGIQPPSVNQEQNNISSTPIIPTMRVTQSNFIPREDNLLFQSNSVRITLREPFENILVSGQCKIKILLGEVILNNCHILSSDEGEDASVYELIGLQSQSLPIIGYHGEEESTFELINFYNGLENIGNVARSLRNLVKHQQEENEDGMTTGNLFKDYSFEILFNEKNGICGLDINNTWIDELNELKEGYKPLKIMIIGNKNTGKSTFCKTLLNELLLLQPLRKSVDYLDLDPGQSEYSHPYTLSLSKINQVQFGFNTCKLTHDRIDHYFGFTSSIHSPTRYMKIIEDLYSKYEGKNHLIINTPGYIKGFGKELLNEITNLVQPDRLIILSNNLSLEYPDNMYLLQDLQYDEVKILPGIYQLSKYSAPELRSINKLLYFHESKTIGCFNFSKRLLDVSPLKLSYNCPLQKTNQGGIIDTVTTLNFDITKDFNVCSLLEVSICGIYLTKQQQSSITPESPSNRNHPYFINQKDFDSVFTSKDLVFVGLLIVHSINLQSHYMNIYAPNSVVEKLQKGIKQGHKIMLVKGDGEVPSCEILHPKLVDLKLNCIKQKKKSKDSIGKLNDFNFPYVNFQDKRIKIGGIWKVRKNIMRRSHNHQRG